MRSSDSKADLLALLEELGLMKQSPTSLRLVGESCDTRDGLLIDGDVPIESEDRILESAFCHLLPARMHVVLPLFGSLGSETRCLTLPFRSTRSLRSSSTSVMSAEEVNSSKPSSIAPKCWTKHFAKKCCCLGEQCISRLSTTGKSVVRNALSAIAFATASIDSVVQNVFPWVTIGTPYRPSQQSTSS